ncbi:MAG: MBL fold metallo-hydrolase [Thermodesulfobacteriota bacterium]
MRITCLGATRTVTGSCFQVDMNGRDCLLVDCGLFQGGKQTEQRNYATGSYRVPDLKAILITHAHMDHSGLVPRLVKQGYRGPVYATEATCDLLRILWLDAAHIQEMEAEWQTRKNKRRGRRQVEPLYETRDAEASARLLKPAQLETEFKPLPAVRARYVQAGHILGSASLHLTLSDGEGEHRVGFSGDLGRPGQLIVADPERLPPLDTLFMETTYGGRRHKSLEDSRSELLGVIKAAYRDQGKVIIPAFAVERTQEIIYHLARAHESGDLPADMPVYLDSPLAIKATEVFNRHPELYDQEARQVLYQGHNPLDLPSLRCTSTSAESQAINEETGPAVIIAGSGMANAGRIKHHLKHHLWRPNCHVVIVGFQAEGTLGRRLVEGAKKVNILGEEVVVKSQVHTIGGFSAHADQEELLAWLAPQAHPGLNVHLVHGEENSSLTFQQVAESRFPQARFDVPRWKEVIALTPAPALEAAPPVIPDLSARVLRLRQRLIEMEKRLAAGQGLAGESAVAALERAVAQGESMLG